MSILPLPARQGEFTSQRLKLAYAEWGDKEAPLIVMVHGGRDQKRSWDWVANALSANYRVATYDLRGHGASEWVSDGDYGVMDHVYDLASFMEFLEADNPYLIGHSLGGNITLRYTGLFPNRIKKLVAIEGLGPSPKMLAERRAEPPADRMRNWIDQRRTLSARSSRVIPTVDDAIERMRAAHSHLRPDQIEHLARTGVRHNDNGTVSWAYDPAVLGRSPSDIPHDEFVTLWKEITCSTWLVYGANSWASNPEKDGRAAHFSTAKVDIIENAGHWLHHDQFDEFMDKLNTFLRA